MSPSKTYRCVACQEPHTTNYKLCPNCEAWTQRLLIAQGKPVRTPC